MFVQAHLEVSRLPGSNWLWFCNNKKPDGWRVLGFNLGSLVVRLWVQ